MSDALNHELEQLLQQRPATSPELSGRRVAVYGAGGFGRLIGRLIENAGGEVRYFLDRQPRTDFPWPVRALADLDASAIAAVDAVVLGIFNPYVNPQEIARQLTAHGFSNILTPVQFYQSVAACQPPAQYWLTQPAVYHSQAADVIAALDYFAEPASRRLYVDLWRYRLTGDIGALPLPTSQDRQYFPDDLPSTWTLPLRFMDCGAYNGDTLRFIRQQQLPMAAVAAFEPDPDNYRALVEGFVVSSGLQQSVLLPCGVYHTAAQLTFMADGSAGAAVSANGNITVQCVSIDESLPIFSPNLIKMDVEGSEMDALAGARKTITASRPGLAISAYHTPHHLWQIPALLASWDLGYRFYLRAHMYQGFDTVLYALPSNN